MCVLDGGLGERGVSGWLSGLASVPVLGGLVVVVGWGLLCGVDVRVGVWSSDL